MLDYFLPVITDEGYTLSIDKIKLTAKYLYGFEDIFLNSVYLDNYGRCDYYKKSGFNKYNHMFVVTVDDVSIVFGFGFRDNNGKNTNKVFCEYNPNKVAYKPSLMRCLKKFYGYIRDVEVKRYDVALDICLPRGKLFLRQADGRNYTFIKTSKGLTEYSGQRSQSGHIKLYDKTKESKLDYTVTRFELTLESIHELNDINKYFDLLLVLPDYVDLHIKDTDKAILGMLMYIDNPSQWYSLLGRDKKGKILPYLRTKKFFIEKVYINHIHSNLGKILRCDYE